MSKSIALKSNIAQLAWLPLCAGMLTASQPAIAAEREARVHSDAFACTSFAGWREYVAASLRPGGARANRNCPARIPVGQRVTIVDDGDTYDWGEVKLRWRGKVWFVSEDRLRR